MAGTEYVIRIEDDTTQTASSPVASQGMEQDVQGQLKQHRQASAGDYIASRALMPMVKSIVANEVSTVAISTGSQELQQRTDLAMSVVQTGINTVSTVMGAAAAFGPAGVAVGLAVSALNLMTQFITKYDQTQKQIRLEGEQLALYRSRFGAGFNQSRNGGTA